MYAQSQKFPTSPGIKFEKRADGKFHKVVMGASNSLSALQYLEYQNEYSTLLIGSEGKRVPLQHQYFRGEASIDGLKPDGFAEVNGQKIFFEFNGSEF